MKMRVFDPRDPAQCRANPDTWKETENPVLQMVAMALNSFPAMQEPKWDVVGKAADYCDEEVIFTADRLGA